MKNPFLAIALPGAIVSKLFEWWGDCSLWISHLHAADFAVALTFLAAATSFLKDFPDAYEKWKRLIRNWKQKRK